MTREVRSRDAQASRRAILDAAEECFARKGFAASSVQEIARLAGVSRGTPAYFFGSKEELYRSVLTRAFADARSTVAEVRDQMARTHLRPREYLAVAVAAYFDYLVDNPNFVLLVEREALSGGGSLSELPEHVASLEDGLDALLEVVDDREERQSAQHLLTDLIALCWFPIAHAHTLLPALGVDGQSSEYLRARKQHVIELLSNAYLTNRSDEGRR